MTMRKTVVATLALAAVMATTVAAATRWRVSTAEMSRLSVTGDVAIANADDRTGTLRVRFVLPSKWRRDSGLSGPRVRFDTRNSCHHKVTFTGRLVQAADERAVERAEALTPASRRYVEAYGTREGAAFRVVRRRGTDELTAVLVQPISATGVAAGQRVYAEVHARAKPDPRIECHSGGPRAVADTVASGFAAGGAGGFVHTR